MNYYRVSLGQKSLLLPVINIVVELNQAWGLKSWLKLNSTISNINFLIKLEIVELNDTNLSKYVIFVLFICLKRVKPGKLK